MDLNIILGPYKFDMLPQISTVVIILTMSIVAILSRHFIATVTELPNVISMMQITLQLHIS